MSKAHLGKPLSQSHSDNIGKALMGHSVSQKQREITSKTHKGKIVSKETLLKMSLSGSLPIRCIETGQIFISTKEAAKVLGINKGNLSSTVNGQRKSCGGLHFEKVSK